MTKAGIIKAITSSNLSQQDLIDINRAVGETFKTQQSLACVAAGANFSVGDQVTWSSRRGTFKGELVKINQAMIRRGPDGAGAEVARGGVGAAQERERRARRNRAGVRRAARSQRAA